MTVSFEGRPSSRRLQGRDRALRSRSGAELSHLRSGLVPAWALGRVCRSGLWLPAVEQALLRCSAWSADRGAGPGAARRAQESLDVAELRPCGPRWHRGAERVGSPPPGLPLRPYPLDLWGYGRISGDLAKGSSRPRAASSSLPPGPRGPERGSGAPPPAGLRTASRPGLQDLSNCQGI